MDVTKKLILMAAGEPKTKWAELAFEAVAHIESLREQIDELKRDEDKFDYWDAAK